MFSGIHNHALEPKLACRLIAGRIKEEEMKRVVDMKKSLAFPRNILTDLKKKTKKVWHISNKCTMLMVGLGKCTKSFTKL